MKKKIFIIFLCALTTLSGQQPAPFATGQDMQDAVEEMNALHNPNLCTEDSAFVEIGSSMFAWGIGLAIGIALLTGFLKQSKAD